MTYAPDLRPEPRETVPSFISRLAASKGVTADNFCLDMGVSLKRLVLLDVEAVTALGRWGSLSDADLKELLSWTGVPVGNVRMTFRGEVMVSRALRNPILRGCRSCLVENIRHHPAEPKLTMVMKGDWQFRDTCVCLKHRALLTELWTEQTPVRRFDVGARLEEMLGLLLQKSDNQPDLVLSAYDLWLDRRLASGDDPTWMAAIPLVAM